MSKQHSNAYTIVFVIVIAGVCAFMLSFAATSLKERQEANARLDMQRNILKAMGMIAGPDEEPEGRQLPAKNTGAQVDEFVSQYVETVYIDASGNVIEMTADEKDAASKLKAEAQKKLLANDATKAEAKLPIYILKDESGEDVVSYAIPIEGKGLWSTLYGFLALEGDANTVRGITFYKHGETPGLGGEVENASWQAQWTGTYGGEHKDEWEKKILDPNGALVSVTVKKGGAARDNSHAVDGLAGATMTSDGVTDFLKEDLEIYEPYFDKVRTGE